MATYTDIIIVPIFAAFLVMKLACVDPICAWSWWWITAPLWGGLALNFTLKRLLFGTWGIIAPWRGRADGR